MLLGFLTPLALPAAAVPGQQVGEDVEDRVAACRALAGTRWPRRGRGRHGRGCEGDPVGSVLACRLGSRHAQSPADGQEGESSWQTRPGKPGAEDELNAAAGLQRAVPGRSPIARDRCRASRAAGARRWSRRTAASGMPRSGAPVSEGDGHGYPMTRMAGLPAARAGACRERACSRRRLPAASPASCRPWVTPNSRGVLRDAGRVYPCPTPGDQPQPDANAPGLPAVQRPRTTGRAAVPAAWSPAANRFRCGDYRTCRNWREFYHW